MMAFQAGGPHAQDRGLEAVAYAYVEQVRAPPTRPMVQAAGQARPAGAAQELHRTSRAASPCVIGCNTFPTWNGYPGLFASLATGNAVLVKPHPRAVLPLALTVRVAREVLAEAGFDPNLVPLAAERPGEGIAKTLAVRPEIKIIDYTGVRPPSATGWRPTPARRRSTRRRPASTPSSSTPPTTTRACSPTWPSRCRCTAARCARPRRTSSSRADGIRPTPGHQVVRRGGRPTSRPRSAACSATTRGRTPCWAHRQPGA